jgi:uncharacterized protein YdeI (BOF family)
MKLLLAIFAIALTTATAMAQTSGGTGGRQKSHRQEQTGKSTAPKADDKAYNAALRSLPNKPYDPWNGAR